MFTAVPARLSSSSLVRDFSRARFLPGPLPARAALGAIMGGDVQGGGDGSSSSDEDHGVETSSSLPRGTKLAALLRRGVTIAKATNAVSGGASAWRSAPLPPPNSSTRVVPPPSSGKQTQSAEFEAREDVSSEGEPFGGPVRAAESSATEARVPDATDVGSSESPNPPAPTSPRFDAFTSSPPTDFATFDDEGGAAVDDPEEENAEGRVEEVVPELKEENRVDEVLATSEKRSESGAPPCEEREEVEPALPILGTKQEPVSEETRRDLPDPTVAPAPDPDARSAALRLADERPLAAEPERGAPPPPPPPRAKKPPSILASAAAALSARRASVRSEFAAFSKPADGPVDASKAFQARNDAFASARLRRWDDLLVSIARAAAERDERAAAFAGSERARGEGRGRRRALTPLTLAEVR